ncbi:MAG: hypothetical protein HKP61_08145 [Dactylosporangium sp.]|nr:hypothetical protein [Dactylosporangium sp.]NNJ60908.1 hypothetical protein [Dactylosporangium sp.]
MGSAFAGAVAVAVLLAPLLLPVHLRMTATEQGLTIEPRGFDAVWTLRWRIVVPADQITSIRVVPRSELRVRGLRLPGVCIPGLIIAGSFGAGQHRTLADIRRGEELLVVYCRTGSPYRAFVLEFPDPHAVLGRAQAALRR